MNKGMFKLGTRELDCAELPAQNGIVHTLGTLYHCVQICSVSPIFAQFRPYLLGFAHICSVSPCQKSLEKECGRGYKIVHCLGAKEKMWTR